MECRGHDLLKGVLYRCFRFSLAGRIRTNKAKISKKVGLFLTFSTCALQACSPIPFSFSASRACRSYSHSGSSSVGFPGFLVLLGQPKVHSQSASRQPRPAQCRQAPPQHTAVLASRQRRHANKPDTGDCYLNGMWYVICGSHDSVSVALALSRKIMG